MKKGIYSTILSRNSCSGLKKPKQKNVSTFHKAENTHYPRKLHQRPKVSPKSKNLQMKVGKEN